MDYENNPKGGGEMGVGGNVFHLSADMFPEGMAKTLKAGEVIEFRIVSPLDKDGDVAVEYNTGDEKQQESPSEEQEQGSDWESSLRSEMSPQSEDKGGY